MPACGARPPDGPLLLLQPLLIAYGALPLPHLRPSLHPLLNSLICSQARLMFGDHPVIRLAMIPLVHLRLVRLVQGKRTRKMMSLEISGEGSNDGPLLI